MELRFYLNGTEVSWDVKPNEYLSKTLRSHGIFSIRVGCDETACGSCTVLVDDKPVLSCGVLSMKVMGKHVTTVEGIQEEAKRLADYIADEGGDQCSFCGTGIALTVYALKKEYKHPTDEQIEKYMVGNLCRCSGYQSHFIAIKKYLEAEEK